jgi:hypothetical protein
MATADEATDEYGRPGFYDPVSAKWRQMVLWLTPRVRAISSAIGSWASWSWRATLIVSGVMRHHPIGPALVSRPLAAS